MSDFIPLLLIGGGVVGLAILALTFIGLLTVGTWWTTRRTRHITWVQDRTAYIDLKYLDENAPRHETADCTKAQVRKAERAQQRDQQGRREWTLELAC